MPRQHTVLLLVSQAAVPVLEDLFVLFLLNIQFAKSGRIIYLCMRVAPSTNIFLYFFFFKWKLADFLDVINIEI